MSSVRHYSLDIEALSRLIEVELEGKAIPGDEYLYHKIFGDWYSWDLRFVCLATVLSRVLERKQKQSTDVTGMLYDIYSISEEKGLVIEGINETFVAYMLQCVREDSLSIDEDLNDVCEHYYSFDYRFQK